MRYRTVLSIITVIIIVGATLALLFAGEKPAVTTIDPVSIAVARTPLSAPFFIAQELGYFTEAGLDVTLVPTISGAEAIQKVTDGVTQFGTTSEIPIVKSSFENTNFTVLANFARSNRDVSLLTLTSSGITAPSHFRGKRIGITFGTSGEYFLDRYLLYSGIDSKDVIMVSLAPDEMQQALLDGFVDAVAIWQPHVYEIQQAAPTLVTTFQYGSELYSETFNLVGDRQYVLENNAVAIKLLSALDRALDDIHSQTDEVTSIVGQYLNQSTDYVSDVLPQSIFRLTLEEALLQTFLDVASWMIAEGKVSRQSSPDYSFFINYSALEYIHPEAVTIIR